MFYEKRGGNDRAFFEDFPFKCPNICLPFKWSYASIMEIWHALTLVRFLTLWSFKTMFMVHPLFTRRCALQSFKELRDFGDPRKNCI